MNFQQIKTFCSVYETHSMTASAKSLGLTQPAVSQQIQALEDELDSSLFLRTSRNMQPSQQGEVFYHYARQILRLSIKAELAVSASRQDVSGKLRIGTLNSIGLHFVGPVFSIFLRNNQNVQMRLHYDFGFKLLEMLKRAELDLVIAPYCAHEKHPALENIERVTLIKDQMVLVKAPRSKPSLRTEIKLNEIANMPFVRITDEYTHFEATLQKELKKREVKLKPVFESSNVGTLKRVIESDIGWGFLPLHSVAKQIASNRLKLVEIKDFSFDFEIACFHRKDAENSRAAELFMSGIMDFSGQK